MTIRLAADLQSDSIVDGEGIRTVIWTQGCPHHCFGCHNPVTHDFLAGYEIDVEEIKKEIDALQNQNGITFSGGDPMCQPEACSEIAIYAKEKGLNIWCYTGYTFEQLLNLGKSKPSILKFLNVIDVLIDGKFIMDERTLDTPFRGSKNQRIIDVETSLKTGNITIISKYDNVDSEINKRDKYLYI